MFFLLSLSRQCLPGIDIINNFSPNYTQYFGGINLCWMSYNTKNIIETKTSFINISQLKEQKIKFSGKSFVKKLSKRSRTMLKEKKSLLFHHCLITKGSSLTLRKITNFELILSKIMLCHLDW